MPGITDLVVAADSGIGQAIDKEAVLGVLPNDKTSTGALSTKEVPNPLVVDFKHAECDLQNTIKLKFLPLLLQQVLQHVFPLL